MVPMSSRGQGERERDAGASAVGRHDGVTGRQRPPRPTRRGCKLICSRRSEETRTMLLCLTRRLQLIACAALALGLACASGPAAAPASTSPDPASESRREHEDEPGVGTTVQSSVGSSLARAAEGTVLRISVEADGTMHLSIEQGDVQTLAPTVVTHDELRGYARATHASDPETTAVLIVDPAAPHGLFIAVVDLLRTESVTRFTVAGHQ
jgi:biopolymer transport protein ExbD